MHPVLSTTLLALFAVFATSCTTSPQPNRREQAMARFAEIDTNHDGKLDYPEFKKTKAAARTDDPAQAFRKGDANGDGYLTPQEIRAFFQSLR